MDIYYSEETATYWLEIDNSTIRIPFDEEPDRATDYNVVLFHQGAMVVSLWSSKAKEFRGLWNNRDNKNDKV